MSLRYVRTFPLSLAKGPQQTKSDRFS